MKKNNDNYKIFYGDTAYTLDADGNLKKAVTKKNVFMKVLMSLTINMAFISIGIFTMPLNMALSIILIIVGIILSVLTIKEW